MSSRRRHVQKRDPGAQRSSRLNELLREIIAEELTQIDDERLEWRGPNTDGSPRHYPFN